MASRVKTSEGAIVCVTICLMGAPYVLGEHLNGTLGTAMFWGGLIGLILFVAWKAWLGREESSEGSTDNQGGAFAGRDNVGSQTVVHGNQINIHPSAPRSVGMSIQGSGTTLTDCDFEGFDQAVEVAQSASDTQFERVTAKAAAPPPPPPTMLELFQADFPGLGKLFEETTIQFGADSPKSTFYTNIYHDFGAGSKFVAFYVPTSPLSMQIYAALPDQYLAIMDRMEQGVQVSGRMSGENITTTSSGLTFTGFVYLYCDDAPTIHELSDLTRLYESKGLKLRVRSSDYRTMKIIDWHHARSK